MRTYEISVFDSNWWYPKHQDRWFDKGQKTISILIWKDGLDGEKTTINLIGYKKYLPNGCDWYKRVLLSEP